jgi:hypothetical protein
MLRGWMRRTLVSVVVVVSLLAWVGPAEAQRAYRRGRSPYDGYARMQVHIIPYGVYVGAGLVGLRILDQSGGEESEGELLDDGAGLTLFTGIRLSQRLALELGWVATFHNPESLRTNFGSDTDYLVLNGFTADAKIYLGEGESIVDPFLQGGVGLYLLDSTYFGAQSLGTGFQAGGGFEFHLGPQLDLGVRALYRGVAMGPPRSGDEDTFVSAAGLEANLSLRF